MKNLMKDWSYKTTITFGNKEIFVIGAIDTENYDFTILNLENFEEAHEIRMALVQYQ